MEEVDTYFANLSNADSELSDEEIWIFLYIIVQKFDYYRGNY